VSPLSTSQAADELPAGCCSHQTSGLDFLDKDLGFLAQSNCHVYICYHGEIVGETGYLMQ
jgi:hypothetical protein